LLIAVSALTIAAVGVAGCPAAPSGSAAPGAGSAMVTVDGEPQNVDGPVVCGPAASEISTGMAIGSSTGATVFLVQNASVVLQVEIGLINDPSLRYTKGDPGENAIVTKDGNRYTITGTAGDVSARNYRPPDYEEIRKPFEIDVTCP
jgi:lipoprotein LpqH